MQQTIVPHRQGHFLYFVVPSCSRRNVAIEVVDFEVVEAARDGQTVVVSDDQNEDGIREK
jgi:hypothetical protein